MKPIKQWFGLGPYDEYEGYETHWYNRHYEFSGTRIRFLAGDLLVEEQEQNGGGPHPRFLFEFAPMQSDMETEFYLPDNEKAHYDIHILNVTLWRWGFYLSIRGRMYA